LNSPSIEHAYLSPPPWQRLHPSIRLQRPVQPRAPIGARPLPRYKPHRRSERLFRHTDRLPRSDADGVRGPIGRVGWAKRKGRGITDDPTTTSRRGVDGSCSCSSAGFCCPRSDHPRRITDRTIVHRLYCTATQRRHTRITAKAIFTSARGDSAIATRDGRVHCVDEIRGELRRSLGGPIPPRGLEVQLTQFLSDRTWSWRAASTFLAKWTLIRLWVSIEFHGLCRRGSRSSN
jgi:hypothetical protein